MRFFRSCLAVFCFGLFGLGGIVVGMILFPIFTFFVRKEKKQRVLSATVRSSWIFFVKVMTFLRLIKVEVKGKTDFKHIKGHIIVANHPTLIDVILLVSLIPNCICVVKNKLANNFFIKHIIRGVYLVNNEKAEDFLKKGSDLLANDMNIVIFPEGTRTTDFLKPPEKLYRGFAQLAVRSKAPVLPVRIDCNPLILGKNQKWYDVDKKTVLYTFLFLSPVKADTKATESFHHQSKELSEKIKEKLFKRTY